MTAPTIPTFADFLRLIDRNALARAAWHANLQAGASTEQALIGVIVTLAEDREKWIADGVRQFWEPKPVVFASGKPPTVVTPVVLPDLTPPPGPTLRPIVCEGP